MLFYESTSFPRDPGPEHVDYGRYAASRAAQEAIQDLFRLEKSWEGPSGRYDRLFIKARKRA